MTYYSSFGKYETFHSYIQALLAEEANHPGKYEYYPNRAKHDNSEGNAAPDYGRDEEE